MNESFLTFKKFKDLELAKIIANQLKQSNIEFLLEDNPKFFDPTFANNTFDPYIFIKIKPGDFTRANEALEEHYKISLNSVDSDYYLFEFTDHELLEIISKPDEWGPLDYQLSKKILTDRGKEVRPNEEALLKEKRLNELKKPESSPEFWIYFGYISAILGGFFGIIIGSSLIYLKKTLPNGQRVYTYGDKERKHGKRMLFISCIFLILYLIMALNQ
jgi:hypothetical protein